MVRLHQAFVDGDAHALLDGAADRVELALPGRSKLYSRAQATYVLQDFFRQFPPDRFEIDREAKLEDSWIASGTYWHRQDEVPFKVYVRMRRKGDRWELREMHIEQRG